jgi:hypothetical protein
MTASPDGKVYASDQGELTVSISPSSWVMDIGQSKIFTSDVSGGTGPYLYQWYMNSEPISGANGSTYTFAPSPPPSSVSIYVVVNDSATIPATAMSNTATVTVNPTMHYDNPPYASSSEINALNTSTVLICGAVSGGTPPYTYQWYEMNNESYSEISGATSSNYTFTPNDTATTPQWTFEVKVTDSADEPVWLPSESVCVHTSQKVPAPQIQTVTPAPGEGYAIWVGYPSGANFSFGFDVRRWNDTTNGLVFEYQGDARLYVPGTALDFQFTLMSGTNWNYSHIYINCSGDIIPIYLYNCSSFDMVTSNVTYEGNVPTFTNVITFHDIALQTYDDNVTSSITLVFTQHFIADWTKFKIQTDTYADLTKMKLYYSNQSAVQNNTKFSLSFDYRVGLGNMTPTDQYGSVEIPPTRVTQTSLYFDVNGTGGMQYSVADMTLDDNYTEVQDTKEIPNRTAIAYFSSISPLSHQKEQIFSQRFTNLTYGVTKAIRSDPTISVMHSQIPWSAPVPEINNVGVAIGATIVILVSIVFLKKKKIRGTS